jgi:hypothetical protein
MFNVYSKFYPKTSIRKQNKESVSVILKFMQQFNFAKCQKIKCQETSKGIRFSVACIPKKRIIDDFSKRQIDFCIL